ncbi:hypothetical protein KIW84_014924 [Lathyrus oleraceus]|uniref:Uncharacterized protein n=1 Tax=Pisum sativum TaxID=3888 RepID=A0A9D5BNX3_PEA|nr:hypothetical protein KIW84_014924 [Pisum sativum]
MKLQRKTPSILHRTASFTANVLATAHPLLFLIDARAGLHPLDQEVGNWFRRNAPQIKPILVINKSESLFDADDSLTSAANEMSRFDADDSLASAANEMSRLGFGDPIAISAETGLGMHDLFLSLKPVLEDYIVSLFNDESARKDSCGNETSSPEADESKLPLQLAVVGRPNVVGLTRDAIRTQFEFQGRTIYLVDIVGWLQRTKLEKGASSLSIMQSRKSLLWAHIVALVLDADEMVNAKRSMKHAEVVIARRAVEEGCGLVVIVNKMDLLRGKDKSSSYEQIMEVVQKEIQTVIPQVTGIPVLFISALEGRGRTTVLHQVIDTYEKWCTRLSTGRLNRWLQKVMSRHSWKDQTAQPKIKYFTQVKARPLHLLRLCVGRPDFLIQTSANMKHLPKTPPTLARFENPSITRPVGSQVGQSQVIIASASTSSVQSLVVSAEAQFPSTTAISSATTSSPSTDMIKMQSLKVLV